MLANLLHLDYPCKSGCLLLGRGGRGARLQLGRRKKTTNHGDEMGKKDKGEEGAEASSAMKKRNKRK